MNSKLRTEAKNDFEKDFFKLMNNSVFGKRMENARKHRYIKLVTADKKISQFSASDVKKRYDTSNYEVDRPLPKGMNNKVIGLMKDELGGKIITGFVALRPKTYSYLKNDDKNVGKAKETKKRVIKRILKFNDYKNCSFKNGIILKLQQRFKSEGLCVYTEEVNTIALESNDDKRLQTFDRTNAFKVCKSEMLRKHK